MNRLFFELIQIALDQSEKLPHDLSDREWMELFNWSNKQAIAGITFAALDKLHKKGQKPPVPLIYEWFGSTQIIRARNAQLDDHCKNLIELLSQKNIRCSILKGQGLARYYDENLRQLRQAGDIDVYVNCGLKEAISLAHALGQTDLEWDYQHLHLNLWPDVEIEVHYRAEILFNLNKNKQLQKWFKDNQESLFSKEGELIVPSVYTNLVYVLLHIYRHFLTEGVGLRQLMDYYFVLKKAKGSFEVYADGKTLVETLKSFGLFRFTQGLMWVLQEVFCLERNLMICDPIEKEGAFILSEVMSGGNFGHYDERLNHRKGKISTFMDIVKHNMRLFSHYPADSIWASLWLVFHRLWKIKTRLALQ